MIRRPQVHKKKDLSKQFLNIFEICGDEIIKYLTLQDQSNLKKVCRITFYMVQCSQIWSMMVFDTDGLSQASTNDDSSYLKNSFYSKVGKSRPSTQESIRQEQWLIQPEEFRAQKPKFLKSKNTIEDNFLNDQELRNTIDVWILNLGQLEKQTKIELILTDSLMQEISLWVDNINILKQLKQEIQLEHVVSIMKMLKQRSILDIGFERKQQIIHEQLKHLVGDLEEKQQFVKELLSIKPIFQQFLQIKLGDFYEIQFNLWKVIDRLRQLKLFNLRKQFIYTKIFSITTKLFKVNISWMADLQNYDTNLQILEQLQTFLNDLQLRSELLQIINYRKGIDDMIKMLKLNKKLHENSSGNLGVQQMLNYYKQKQFDQFQDKVKWNEIYKQWKEKYQGQRKQPEVGEEKNEAISFGLYQTKMNWSFEFSPDNEILNIKMKKHEESIQDNNDYQGIESHKHGIKKKINKQQIRQPMHLVQRQTMNFNFYFGFPFFPLLLPSLLKKQVQQSWIDKIPILVDVEEIMNSTCSICLVEYQQKDIAQQLKCDHIFHAQCLKKWLLTKAECPTCRNKCQ